MDALFISYFPHDNASDWGPEEIANTKVGELDKSTLSAADTKNGLEMLVENIEETVGKSPSEKQACDETEADSPLLPSQSEPKNIE